MHYLFSHLIDFVINHREVRRSSDGTHFYIDGYIRIHKNIN
jgi:hypothetical protein